MKSVETNSRNSFILSSFIFCYLKFSKIFLKNLDTEFNFIISLYSKWWRWSEIESRCNFTSWKQI